MVYKMAKTKKGQPTPVQHTNRKEIVSDDDLKRLLLVKTDQRSTSKGTDEVLDRVNEKAGLVNDPEHGRLIGSLKAYSVKFTDEFYDPIYKLRGMIKDRSNRRPCIFAKITNDLVYLRFPVGTLRRLQALNPKIDGQRLFKHFQLLTDLGEIGLAQFMSEAIALMNECTHYDEFVRKFSRKYNKPWQGHLFDKD